MWITKSQASAVNKTLVSVVVCGTINTHITHACIRGLGFLAEPHLSFWTRKNRFVGPIVKLWCRNWIMHPQSQIATHKPYPHTYFLDCCYLLLWNWLIRIFIVKTIFCVHLSVWGQGWESHLHVVCGGSEWELATIIRDDDKKLTLSDDDAGPELPDCDVDQDRDEAQALIHDITMPVPGSIIHHQTQITQIIPATRCQLTTPPVGWQT